MFAVRGCIRYWGIRWHAVLHVYVEAGGFVRESYVHTYPVPAGLEEASSPPP